MIYGVPAKRFFRELYKEISDDDVFNGAAVLGFWLTLAIFPAMIFLVATIPYLPVAHVDQAIMDLLRQALPAAAADMFASVVGEVTREPRGGLLSFGLIATFWAASAGMYAIMQQLNVTYDVTEGRNFVKARGTALALSLLFGVLLVVAFSLVVLGGTMQEWIFDRFGVSTLIAGFFIVFRWVMIVLALLLSLAMIYYLGPDVEQEFRFITPGSVIGVLCMIVASLGFKFYATNFGNYSATYGSIGAVIIMMLWLYLTGLVILLGSEVNALIEHYAPEGKEKGEKVEGQRETGAATGIPGKRPPPRPA